MNWEEAVKQMRQTAANRQDILDNYFEEDILASAQRFSNGGEFKAVMSWIPAHAKSVLDIGAGRGIATFGFAQRGFKVTALEPDPSSDVGAGAIRKLALAYKLPIEVTESYGEQLPYPNHTFDVVYARQVLHHAAQLDVFCKEVYRVLKPGGMFIATREHVISHERDLERFLQQHPLHKWYGGEHAFTLSQYRQSIVHSGLKLTNVLHPFESEINYAPMTTVEMQERFAKTLSKWTGKKLAQVLVKQPVLFRFMGNIKSFLYNEPGRLYSFIAIKNI